MASLRRAAPTPADIAAAVGREMSSGSAGAALATAVKNAVVSEYRAGAQYAGEAAGTRAFEVCVYAVQARCLCTHACTHAYT